MEQTINQTAGTFCDRKYRNTLSVCDGWRYTLANFPYLHLFWWIDLIAHTEPRMKFIAASVSIL